MATWALVCLCQCTHMVQDRHAYTYVCMYTADRHFTPLPSLAVCRAAYIVTRLKGFSSAYELVKSEKNKIVTLIQHASQVTILCDACYSCTTYVRTYVGKHVSKGTLIRLTVNTPMSDKIMSSWPVSGSLVSFLAHFCEMADAMIDGLRTSCHENAPSPQTTSWAITRWLPEVGCVSL